MAAVTILKHSPSIPGSDWTDHFCLGTAPAIQGDRILDVSVTSPKTSSAVGQSSDVLEADRIIMRSSSHLMPLSSLSHPVGEISNEIRHLLNSWHSSLLDRLLLFVD